MKTHDLNRLDQSDAETLLSRLQLHAANLRGLLHTAEGTLVTPPAVSGKDDIFGNIRALEQHCGELEARLGDTAPTFNSTLTPAATPSADSVTKSPAKKLNLTEKVLAARGVQRLDQLKTHNDPLD